MGIFSKLINAREVESTKIEDDFQEKALQVEGIEIIDLDTPDIGRYEEDIIEITPSDLVTAESEEVESEEVESEEVDDLTQNTKVEPEEDSLALAAELLLQGTISVEEKLENIHVEQERVAMAIGNLLGGREKMLKAKTYCQQMNKKSNGPLSKTFDEYLINDDFRDIPKKSYVMEVMKDIVPELYTQPGLPATELRMALEHVNQIWLEVEKEKEVLKEEGELLRKEITQFSTAVNEMRTKHKLSPDWDGKKQPLMVMQGKLSAKREDYLKRELAMDRKISELSMDYKELQMVFEEHNTYFIELLSQKADTFVKDPGRAKKLQELLKKKAKLEMEENQVKQI